jgi:hypothetical protein
MWAAPDQWAAPDGPMKRPTYTVGPDVAAPDGHRRRRRRGGIEDARRQTTCAARAQWVEDVRRQRSRRQPARVTPGIQGLDALGSDLRSWGAGRPEQCGRRQPAIGHGSRCTRCHRPWPEQCGRSQPAIGQARRAASSAVESVYSLSMWRPLFIALR